MKEKNTSNSTIFFHGFSIIYIFLNIDAIKNARFEPICKIFILQHVAKNRIFMIRNNANFLIKRKFIQEQPSHLKIKTAHKPN